MPPGDFTGLIRERLDWKVGMEITMEQIRQVRREGWSGLYLMAMSLRRETMEVLQAGLRL